MGQKVLFVCLGNICRSPIAEAVFLHLIKEKGNEDEWEVDSAGTGGWHVGNQPDYRARNTLQNHSIEYDSKARQVNKSDFNHYDYIFGMDETNLSDLKDMAPKNCKAKILLLGDFDPKEERIIRDPYYDRGSDGFEVCFQHCMRCCSVFLSKH